MHALSPTGWPAARCQPTGRPHKASRSITLSAAASLRAPPPMMSGGDRHFVPAPKKAIMGQAMGKAVGKMMDALGALHEVIAPAVAGDAYSRGMVALQ